MDIHNQYDIERSKLYNSQKRFEVPHQFMAYHTWLEEIGDISGKRVLDLACGGGVSSRMLAEKGAIVTGVDISEPMLAVAEEAERAKPQGIKYVQADASQPKIYGEGRYNLVVAAFLLHYAGTKEILQGFAKTVAMNLAPGGCFVTINMSPDHPILGRGPGRSGVSRWLDEPFGEGSKVEVDLLMDNGDKICTIRDYHWSRQTYEAALTGAGLSDIKWVELRMQEEGKHLPNWQELEKNNMLVVIEAKKN